MSYGRANWKHVSIYDVCMARGGYFSSELGVISVAYGHIDGDLRPAEESFIGVEGTLSIAWTLYRKISLQRALLKNRNVTLPFSHKVCQKQKQIRCKAFLHICPQGYLELYDDIMALKHFHITRPLWGISTGPLVTSGFP